MRLFCSLVLLLMSSQLFAQGIMGMVVDKETKIPVSHAKIKTANSTIYTDVGGRFKIDQVYFVDTVRITHPRYRTYRSSFNSFIKDTVLVYLESAAILLKEVSITSTRNFIKDSLRTRSEFASVFNHRVPTIKDVFVSKSAYGTRIYSKNETPFSTTSIVGLNLLNIVPYLTKNKSSVSKLQKTLLRDEDYKFIKRNFSRDRIVAITNLSGDSLENFVSKYFPTSEEIKKMTDYDLLIYIKTSYREFVKLGNAGIVVLQP